MTQPTTTPTSDAVPSKRPADFLYNVELLDIVMASDQETVVDRHGISRLTLHGALARMGFETEVRTYASGLLMERATQTIDRGGIVYAPLPSAVPFTTSGTWSGSDQPKFRPVQGVTSDDLARPEAPEGIGTPDTEGTLQRVIDAQDYNVFKKFTVAQQADALTGTPAIDTTTLIQAAIDEAFGAGKRCVGYGTFRVGSAKIVFKGDTDFSQATFKVYGTPAIAVEVSTGSAANPTDILNHKVVRLPKRIENMTKPGTGWAAQGIGIRTVNCQSCEVHFGNPVNFAVNALISSYGQGNVHNTYFLGHLENGQINLELTPGNSGAWVNENNLIGGEFAHYSGEGTNVSGTRHIKISKAANPVNNNNFIKPSIEGDTAEFHVENGGCYNTIFQGRWEATTPKCLYTGDNANQGTRNFIIGGYKAESIVISYSGTPGYINTLIAPAAEYKAVTGTYGYKAQNQSSSGFAIQTFYEAGTTYLPEVAAAGAWAVQHGSQFLKGKQATDADARIKINYTNGRIYCGNGAADPTTNWFGALGSGIGWNGILYPGANNTHAIGDASLRWTTAYVNNVVLAPGSSVTPAANGDVTFELTSNTLLKIKARGSDGTVRSVSLTLS